MIVYTVRDDNHAARNASFPRAPKWPTDAVVIGHAYAASQCRGTCDMCCRMGGGRGLLDLATFGRILHQFDAYRLHCILYRAHESCMPGMQLIGPRALMP